LFCAANLRRKMCVRKSINKFQIIPLLGNHSVNFQNEEQRVYVCDTEFEVREAQLDSCEL
jgi:hypothetical protein